MGDAFNDKSHIVSHIKEKYYVPTLFWNAMEKSKSNLAPIAHHNLALLQQKQNGLEVDGDDFVMLTAVMPQYYTAMRKYLKKRLNLSL